MYICIYTVIGRGLFRGKWTVRDIIRAVYWCYLYDMIDNVKCFILSNIPVSSAAKNSMPVFCGIALDKCATVCGIYVR